MRRFRITAISMRQVQGIFPWIGARVCGVNTGDESPRTTPGRIHRGRVCFLKPGVSPKGRNKISNSKIFFVI